MQNWSYVAHIWIIVTDGNYQYYYLPSIQHACPHIINPDVACCIPHLLLPVQQVLRQLLGVRHHIISC